MKTPWLTSAWRNSKSGLPCSAFRFWGEPVMKLSRASTRIPRPSSASQRCEPMKPAPPDTTARGLFAANAAVYETQVPHRGRVVDFSPVHDDRPSHQLLYPRHVELAELVPFRDEDQGVRAGGDLVRVLQILDLGEQHLRSLHRGWVIRAHLGARRQQHLGDVETWRLAHVIGVGLERQPKQADDAARQLLELFAQQVDHDHALVAIDVHDGMQKLGVIVEPLSDRGECGDIFWKTVVRHERTGRDECMSARHLEGKNWSRIGSS